uniref:Uncharacterized protein n=1 Tax=Anguilla anguilla TaxID=7936 RepID=A0A0E9TZ50_ANGAN
MSVRQALNYALADQKKLIVNVTKQRVSPVVRNAVHFHLSSI